MISCYTPHRWLRKQQRIKRLPLLLLYTAQVAQKNPKTDEPKPKELYTAQVAQKRKFRIIVINLMLYTAQVAQKYYWVQRSVQLMLYTAQVAQKNTKITLIIFVMLYTAQVAQKLTLTSHNADYDVIHRIGGLEIEFFVLDHLALGYTPHRWLRKLIRIAAIMLISYTPHRWLRNYHCR